LFKRQLIRRGGHTFEERLREGEGARIPRGFLSLEGKSFNSQKEAHIPRRIGMHF
jgi:hypothetical protein